MSVMFSPPAIAVWDELVGDAGTYATAHAATRTRKRKGPMDDREQRRRPGQVRDRTQYKGGSGNPARLHVVY